MALKSAFDSALTIRGPSVSTAEGRGGRGDRRWGERKPAEWRGERTPRGRVAALGLQKRLGHYTKPSGAVGGVQSPRSVRPRGSEGWGGGTVRGAHAAAQSAGIT